MYQRNTALTGIGQYGVTAEGTFSSAATSLGVGFASSFSTEAAAFTMANAIGFRAFDITKGAGSTITNQHGVYIADQTQGTNNYGITSLVSSGTNKWNIYASGTAQNYFAGNVGVGTSSPATKFVVEAATPEVRISSSVNTVSNTNTLRFSSSASSGTYAGGGAYIQSIQGSGVDVYSLAFGTAQSSTTATERMRIDSSGSVGIGTSSPAAKVHVEGSGTTTAATVLVKNISTAASTYGSVETQSDSTSALYLRTYSLATTSAAFGTALGGASLLGTFGAASTGMLVGTNNATPLILGTSNNERMRIDSSGNVGIGTTSPGAKLTTANSYVVPTNGVSSSTVAIFSNNAVASGEANISVLSRSSGYSRMYFGSQTQENAQYIEGYSPGSTAAYLAFGTGTGGSGVSGTERIRIDSSGNVGIGTSSPSASAILDAQSTTKGVRMPNMTTTQKNAISSPAAGLMVFDTTLVKLCVYSGSAWQTVTSI
jgi:hypothetical protein